MRQLVGRAVFKTNSVYEHLNAEDVDMHMSLAHYVSTITRTQREDLANVLLRTTKSTTRQLRQSPLFQLKTEEQEISIAVPTTKQLLRSQLCEGQYAVYPNLPHPKVRMVTDHGYILPSECVADLMPHGNFDLEPKKSINEMQTIPHSPLCKHHEAEDGEECRSITSSLWSDDFVPNYSKGNRGSVWLMTLTIQSTESGNPTMLQVYPIAAGPKGKDHQQK